MRGRCLSLAKVFTLLLPSFIHVIDFSCPIYSARFCSLARGRFLDVQLGHITSPASIMFRFNRSKEPVAMTIILHVILSFQVKANRLVFVLVFFQRKISGCSNI